VPQRAHCGARRPSPSRDSKKTSIDELTTPPSRSASRLVRTAASCAHDWFAGARPGSLGDGLAEAVDAPFGDTIDCSDSRMVQDVAGRA